MGSASSWRSSATTERLAVGRILGAKGLRGAFRIELLTDWPERLETGTLLWLDDDHSAQELVAVEWGGRWPVVRLKGIDDRTAAEALVGRFLEVPARPLPSGSYYWHQLEGLEVSDPSGAPLGVVAEVFRAGENEVYRVVGPDGEVLIPALRDVVLNIDLDARQMVVDYDAEEVP